MEKPSAGKVFEALGLIHEDDVPRFKKVSREVYDLACPWCNKVMREKQYDFKSNSDGTWTHDCCDKPFRSTEEQENTLKDFTKMLSGKVTEDDSEPSAKDKNKVKAILSDKSLPEKAEDGKAYVVFWADGRGVFAVKTKKAIQDWLEKTGSWAEIISIKYGPAEHKGKKLKVENALFFTPLITENLFTVQDDNLDKTYDTFKDTYQKRTGQAWTKDKFKSKVANWTMYGDHDGFVAARQQASGPIKLVGSAGNLQGVKKGLNELLATGKPVWGLMDPRLAAICTRFGMVMPAKWLMKMVFSKMAAKLAPAMGVDPSKISINDDGSLTIDYDDVGKANKVLVGNKEYFQWLLKNHGEQIPAFARTALAHFMTTGKTPAEPVSHVRA